MSYTIYALKDPHTGEIRYVGATHLPLFMRLKFHVGDTSCNDKDSLRVQWLRELAGLGLSPSIEEVEALSTDNPVDVGNKESEWMDHFRELGCDLLNVRDGGAGLHSRDGPSQWALDNLGKMPDTRIARREDKHPMTVRYWRHKRGIPRFRGSYPPDPFGDSSVPVPIQIWNSIQVMKEICREDKILTNRDWER